MRIAIAGATGLVGRKMLQVLDESGLQIDELFLAASERSAGQTIEYKGKQITVQTMQQVLELKPDAALFSAGGDVSLEWAPKFAEAGITVIDNSSAWRMHPDVKLVVPEVNANELTSEDKIIANPNCSTIQLVVALSPLHNKYTINRLIVSTYQAVTGTGNKAVKQLMDERVGNTVDPVYPYPIDLNCIPQCDVFTDNGYTKEEMKIVNETRKILGAENMRITSTAVRVPVIGGHSESVNIEFANSFNIEELKDLLKNSPGVAVKDNPSEKEYPMPLHAHDDDSVFVGRIREDFSNPNTINLWIVADNLRKGAATNAVQILKHLHQSNLL